MTIFVGDVGSVVRQVVSDATDLTGATVTFTVMNPRGIRTDVSGDAAAGGVLNQLGAVTPGGLWTMAGRHRVQFGFVLAGVTKSLGIQTITVYARL